ncbi:intermembrane phospholipid transport protein YdbH family protein [Balneatrix alpica]|uniref:intermembrane phospholipid transport protein YdbH family protein n=1 Tax=Balneatrix alpica TaxID=75684 RepID=UPI00273887DD|nr:YdbH domain-containing protein [Balneatrix alpica]
MRKLGYTLLSLVFILFGLYLTLPTSLPLALDAYLGWKQPGWQLKGIQFEHPTLEHWRFQHLVLEGPEAELQLKDLNLLYHPLQLWREGRLQQLHIREAQLLPRTSSNPGQSALPPLPPLAPSYWLARLPADEVLLNRLLISSPQAELDIGIQGYAKELRLQGELRQPDRPNLALNARLSPDDQAEFELFNDQQQLTLQLGWLPPSPQQPLAFRFNLQGQSALPWPALASLNGQLAGKLALEQQGLRLTLTPGSELAGPLQLAPLPSGEVQLLVEQPTELLWQAGQNLPALQAGSLSLQTHFPERPQDQLLLLIDEIGHERLAGTLLASLSQLTGLGIEQGQLQLALPLSLTPTEQQGWLVSLLQGGNLKLKARHPQQGLLPELKLNWNSALTLLWQAQQGSLLQAPWSAQLELAAWQALAPQRWQLQLERLLIPPDAPPAFAMQGKSSQLQLGSLALTSQIKLTGLEGRTGFDFNLSSANSQLKASGQLAERNLGQLSARLALAELQPWLSLPPEASISGQAEWAGQWQWQKTLFVSGRGRADINLQWPEWPEVKGLSLAYRLDGEPERGSLNLDASLAHYPLAGLADLRLQSHIGYSPEGYAIQLDQFSLQALSGRLRVAPTQFNWPGEIQTYLYLEDLSLSELLGLRPNLGVRGKGSLKGALPIRYDHQGLHIRQGYLSTSTTGGSLSYSLNQNALQLAQQYPQISSVAALLEDFRYQSLDAEVDYAPDGTLVLNTQLSGHNPEFEQGRQVNFNIRIEENLLQLLRSLQLTGKLNTVLGERIKNELEKSP